VGQTEATTSTGTVGGTIVIDLAGEEEDDDDESEVRAKKRIKLEPIIITPRVQPLRDTTASIDSFLSRLARYRIPPPHPPVLPHKPLTLARDNREEEMEMVALKPLLQELVGQGLATVGDLQKLTRDKWRDIMRAANLPVSLTRLAMRLVPATECIILD
jgi:hypothetical protein